jgi:hypothetical protein
MRLMKTRTSSLSILAILLVVAIVGCQGDPEIGVVRGTVKLKGQPITSGTITMEGGPSQISLMAPIGADGTYEMKTHDAGGLPPGSYKVAVSDQRIAEGDLVVLATDVKKAQSPGPNIPQKYRTIETSGLTAEVKSGDNPPFDFDLN